MTAKTPDWLREVATARPVDQNEIWITPEGIHAIPGLKRGDRKDKPVEKMFLEPFDKPGILIETRFIKGRTVRVEHKKRRGK